MRNCRRFEMVPPGSELQFRLHRQRQVDARQPAPHLQESLTMASLVTLLIWLGAISAVFGIVYSDKRIYNAVDDILNRIFKKLD